MLTRRGFLGCGLCALTGFSATDAGAQTPGFKRSLLRRMDGPAPGYETIEARLDIDPGTPVLAHTHFGIETAYVIEGATDLTIAGEGSKAYGPGESWQVPPGVVHSGKNGDRTTVVLATYVVEKGKPLATPA